MIKKLHSAIACELKFNYNFIFHIYVYIHICMYMYSIHTCIIIIINSSLPEDRSILWEHHKINDYYIEYIIYHLDLCQWTFLNEFSLRFFKVNKKAYIFITWLRRFFSMPRVGTWTNNPHLLPKTFHKISLTTTGLLGWYPSNMAPGNLRVSPYGISATVA